jgi:plasmid stability protein
MSKRIQLRNMPDALHRTLKARAAMAGMSLPDWHRCALVGRREKKIPECSGSGGAAKNLQRLE